MFGVVPGVSANKKENAQNPLIHENISKCKGTAKQKWGLTVAII
jgi:hypothetical protein